MECIGNVIEGEVTKCIISGAQGLDAKMYEGTKVDATHPRGPIKGERSANLSPCLELGKDNRRLGV